MKNKNLLSIQLIFGIESKYNYTKLNIKIYKWPTLVFDWRRGILSRLYIFHQRASIVTLRKEKRIYIYTYIHKCGIYVYMYIYIYIQKLRVTGNHACFILVILNYIYIYIVAGKRQINYQFIPTALFRGCQLIRGFNENNLYHRLYTISSNLCSAKFNSLVVA